MPSLPGAIDGRAHRRFRIELEVSLQSDSNFYMGLTQNLSYGGLFVATQLVQPIGTQVEVALRLPTSKAPLSLQGAVRWVREIPIGFEGLPGMGIEFESMSEVDSRIIADFLATRTPLFFDMV
ncbi:MAG TPA: TIGR02266 family protein [Polyangiaceae bacterium]